MTFRTTLVPALALALAGAGAACAEQDDPSSARESTSSPGAGPSPDDASSTAAQAARTTAETVLLISVDGLNPDAVTRLGKRGAPTLTRLLATGTGTPNARTAVESRQTLPNHTGMVTGRRVDAGRGGHGVTWNDDRRGSTVQEAAGEPVASVFTVVDDAGGSSAVFAAKSKFSLFQRSWPRAVDRSAVSSSDTKVVRAVRSDLRSKSRKLRFVHLAAPDKVGHAKGFMGRDYLDAVRRTDRRLAKIFATLRTSKKSRHAAVVLTSDHGGLGANHMKKKRGNVRVVLVARGPAIARGANLYSLDPSLYSPGRAIPGYGTSRPPARNLAAGNLALQAIGLGPVPGSEPEARGPFRLR